MNVAKNYQLADGMCGSAALPYFMSYEIVGGPVSANETKVGLVIPTDSPSPIAASDLISQWVANSFDNKHANKDGRLDRNVWLECLAWDLPQFFRYAFQTSL